MGGFSLAKIACIVFVFCAATAIASPAQTFTTLVNFDGPNGAYPNQTLVQGSDGNFYGITNRGGASNNNCGFPESNGCGTVFRMAPDGTLTTLHSFDYTDGFYLYGVGEGGLVQGSDGNFYGTTDSGGMSENCSLAFGCGTVFKITPGGVLTTLHNFAGYPTDGATPFGGLVQGDDGNFYGTTSGGGTSPNCGSFGCGTVFRITPGGVLTTLRNFDLTDGEGPNPSLVLASDGNFYGTAFFGGLNGNCDGNGCGTVFKITSTGTLTIVYTFCELIGCSDGVEPLAGVVQGSDGDFYGTTYYRQNVFRMTPAGTLNTLHTFAGYPTEGADPDNSLVQGTDGNLYGTTSAGGNSSNCLSFDPDGCGTVFRITPQSPYTLTTLHNFDNTDGAIPNGGLVQATNGAFYGTTSTGGAYGDGTVFSLSVGIVLSPVQFVPVTPCRVVDTRNPNGEFGGPAIQGGAYRFFPIQQGACSIPATAAAYSLNVTVVPHEPLGYLTIWPAGRSQPTVSTMNSPDGRTKANAAIVPEGASGAVSVYVSNTTDVILDIDGYFAPASSNTYQFYKLTPCRLVDTRQAEGNLGGPRLQAQTPRDFPLLSSTCIPSGLRPLAYSLNFTVVPNPGGQQLGYLTVWPAGDTQPVVSTLNNPTATVVANAAIVPAGTNGDIDVFAYNTTDLLIDIDGYFAAPGTNGLSLYPTAPCRVLDTRQVGNGRNGQPFTGTLSPPVNVVGSVCAPPSSAREYVFNATVVPTGSLGYLTLWPDGSGQPVVSTLNAVDGFITSNMAIVPTTNGSIDAYAQGLTQLILDISGYFAP